MLFKKVYSPLHHQSYGALKMSALAATLLGVVLGSPNNAHAAGGWTGQQAATMTGGNVFSIVGNTVTVTQAPTATSMTVAGKFTNAQLLGFSGIWIVDPNGNTIAGVSSAVNGSVITGTSAPTTWDPQSGPTGYYAGPGYGSNTNFIQLVDNATLLSGANKSPSGYNKGVFTFGGLTLLPSYKIGIDYLVASGANGQTGRGFAFVSTRDSNATNPVPEPSEWLAMAMAATSVGGLMIRARRRRSSKSVAA